MFENCASVDVNRNNEIQNVEGDKENSPYKKVGDDNNDEKKMRKVLVMIIITMRLLLNMTTVV